MQLFPWRLSLGTEIRFLWKDKSQFGMMVFQGTFLAGLHGITIEHAGAAAAGFAPLNDNKAEVEPLDPTSA